MSLLLCGDRGMECGVGAIGRSLNKFLLLSLVYELVFLRFIKN
ncbi:hypothetical protein [Microcoleus asticus]|nr:hypothetical protein [Microcoleus asticus]